VGEDVFDDLRVEDDTDDPHSGATFLTDEWIHLVPALSEKNRFYEGRREPRFPGKKLMERPSTALLALRSVFSTWFPTTSGRERIGVGSSH
jgi:hypothetical protein